MDLILDIGPKNLEKVLYFAAYIVIDPGTTEIPFKKILTEQEYRELYDQYGNTFRVGMGAEAIYELLKNVDLESEVAKLKEELENTTSQKAARLIKRIEFYISHLNRMLQNVHRLTVPLVLNPVGLPEFQLRSSIVQTC